MMATVMRSMVDGNSNEAEKRGRGGGEMMGVEAEVEERVRVGGADLPF